eukprot:5609997-Pleurochrysis_carterae.AAC.4
MSGFDRNCNLSNGCYRAPRRAKCVKLPLFPPADPAPAPVVVLHKRVTQWVRRPCPYQKMQCLALHRICICRMAGSGSSVGIEADSFRLGVCFVGVEASNMSGPEGLRTVDTPFPLALCGVWWSSTPVLGSETRVTAGQLWRCYLRGLCGEGDPDELAVTSFDYTVGTKSVGRSD